MFKHTLDNKRYHTLNFFLRNKFNSKVFKVPLNANLDCPNKVNGGCIYCKDNSQSSIINKEDDILVQFNSAKEILHKKWSNAKYIAYFQAGTNTYANIKTLKNLYDKVITLPNVVGLAVATRPDAITDECLDYLEELNNKTFLKIELGLQSSNNKTLKLINRGHSKEDFTACAAKLKERKIFTVAHIINGLPYENKADMINTVKYLNDIKIDAIKIHMLYISKDTPLENLYNKENFPLISKEEYIDITINQLELLNENVVIERITGDPVKEDLIEPTWLLKKFCLLNDIDKEMVKRNTYQGKKNQEN